MQTLPPRAKPAAGTTRIWRQRAHTTTGSRPAAPPACPSTPNRSARPLCRDVTPLILRVQNTGAAEQQTNVPASDRRWLLGATPPTDWTRGPGSNRGTIRCPRPPADSLPTPCSPTQRVSPSAFLARISVLSVYAEVGAITSRLKTTVGQYGREEGASGGGFRYGFVQVRASSAMVGEGGGVAGPAFRAGM